MAESMIFYRSFYEALEGLPDEMRLRVLDSVIRYGLYEEEPELNGVEASLFRLIKPQIDANVERRENGKKGGRPKKPMVSKTKTNGYETENQRLRNQKPNVNVNVNENVNVNANANENENGFNNECITAWGRAQRESDDENPDEDWDLRHQEDCISDDDVITTTDGRVMKLKDVHFGKTVKVGMVRR
ncbi:MAG: hypothetical protein J6Y79_04085 [Paludibacteraceae bacterium]|nr:hypothetical protein [Paludibacteraceae bacterium]